MMACGGSIIALNSRWVDAWWHNCCSSILRFYVIIEIRNRIRVERHKESFNLIAATFGNAILCLWKWRWVVAYIVVLYMSGMR